MDDALLASHVDAIHAVPRDEFVATRQARVRQLRADGHRAEATALSSCRKPTVAAWATNQLPRRHPEAVAELLEAGAALRTAQSRAASGRGAEGLRGATRQVREHVEALADLAAEVLAEIGAAPHHRTDVAQTLFAAATDPALRDHLERGVFEQTVVATGFGAMSPLLVVPDADDEAATATEPPPAEEPEPEPDPEVERRAARRRELEQHRTELQRSLVRDQRRADRTAKRVDELEARLADLQDRMATAREEADGARTDLEILRAELASVDAELADLAEDGAA